MDPRSYIRNGFANGAPPHSHFYAACTSRHQSSMIPKALKIATLQKKNAPMAAAGVSIPSVFSSPESLDASLAEDASCL